MQDALKLYQLLWIEDKPKASSGDVIGNCKKRKREFADQWNFEKNKGRHCQRPNTNH